MILPPYYTEVIQCNGMTCDVAVVISCGRVLEMFSIPLSKGPTIKDNQSKTSWWLQKTKIPLLKRGASYTGINVTGWNVMRSIKVNQQGLLERGISVGFLCFGQESAWGFFWLNLSWAHCTLSCCWSSSRSPSCTL